MNSSLLSERSEFSHSTCTTDACNCRHAQQMPAIVMLKPIFDTQKVYRVKSDNSIF